MAQPLLHLVQRFDNRLLRLALAVTEGETDPLASPLLWYATYLFNNQTKIIDPAVNTSQLSEIQALYAAWKRSYPPPYESLDADDPFHQAPQHRHSSGLTAEGNVHSDPLGTGEPTLINALTDAELLRYVVMDIKRLFPGMRFYDETTNQAETREHKRNLIEILYLFVKGHNLPYKQGLHELCGVVYYNLARAGLPSATSSEGILTGDKRFLAGLFRTESVKLNVLWIMGRLLLGERRVGERYTPESVYSTYYLHDDRLLETIERFTHTLEQLDYNLFHLVNLKNQIDNRIWMIKWFRLLMVRECSPETDTGPEQLWIVRTLWDKVVAYEWIMGKNVTRTRCDFVGLLPYIIMVLLIKFKVHLIVNFSSPTEANDDELLYTLLHFDRFYFEQSATQTRAEIARDWSDIVLFAVKLHLQSLQTDAASASQWWRIGNEINGYFHSKSNTDDFVTKEFAFFLALEAAEEAGVVKLKEQFYNKIKLELKLKYRVLKLIKG